MTDQMTSPTTSFVDGMAVQSRGSGPGLVLLHANGGDHRDFDGVVEQLAAQWTVHAVDWPGHGSSTSTTERSAVAFAAALPSVLRQLPGGPFVVLGNSVGGFAAVRAAAAHPDLVRALVLVSPGGFTPRWPGMVLGCRLIAARRVAPVAMRVLPKLYLRRRSPFVDAIRRRAVDSSRNADAVATFSSVWRSFTARDHDARADAGRVGAPVLLAWGRGDPVLPWRVDGRRARKAMPAAQVATFRCGHQPFAELPDEFLAAVGSFAATLVP